jgi:hypothetical protein
MFTASFLARLRRAGIQGIALPGVARFALTPG